MTSFSEEDGNTTVLHILAPNPTALIVDKQVKQHLAFQVPGVENSLIQLSSPCHYSSALLFKITKGRCSIAQEHVCMRTDRKNAQTARPEGGQLLPRVICDGYYFCLPCLLSLESSMTQDFRSDFKIQDLTAVDDSRSANRGPKIRADLGPKF